MKYRHRLSTRITKTISSLMAIAFALVAFAHGQNCTLLPGWTPSTLMNGQSRTGYQFPEATFTQSCTGAVWIITCVNGSVANGNIFKYPSCIPHTRANCTTPTGANHLEYRTLYKLAQATYTQTCQQLSQNLQCLNWIFTWWTTPNLFTHATCIDPNRAQCIDIRTNSYKDHGETVIWYTTNTPAVGQACTTLKKTLTCYNGTWSWGNQSSLYTWCADDWWAQCLNVRTNTYITHGAPILGYTATHPTLGQTCATLQKTLLCNDGTWSWGNQNSLYSWCTNPWAFSWCLNIRTNTTVPHGSAVNWYTSPVGVCANLLQSLSCVNGLRSGGNQISLYSWCVDANTQSCPNIITNTWTLLNGSFITKYTQQFAFEVNNHYCSDYTKALQCMNGIWSWNVSGLFTWCQNIGSGSCLDTSTNIYTPNLQFITKYTIGQATATQACDESLKQFTCVNGSRTSGNPSTYPFSSCWWCKLPPARWVAVGEWRQWYGYSVTWTMFPQTCNDFSTVLSCSGGILNGNWQTYQYPSSQCHTSGALVSGIDLAIDGSPGIPGQ